MFSAKKKNKKKCTDLRFFGFLWPRPGDCLIPCETNQVKAGKKNHIHARNQLSSQMLFTVHM